MLFCLRSNTDADLQIRRCQDLSDDATTIHESSYLYEKIYFPNLYQVVFANTAPVWWEMKVSLFNTVAILSTLAS